MQVTDCLTLSRSNSMFVFETIDNKRILKSDSLDGVVHFFTTRESVITHRDLPEHEQNCKANLKSIADYLNISEDNIISPVQTHSSNIAIAQKGQSYPDTDALVVDDSDIAIVLNFADCTPVILYDEENNVAAVAHAGWKGTASSIAVKTVEFMKEHYKTQSQNITAAIGPAISMKNYQVDTDVFESIKSTLKGDYTDYFVFDKEANKYNLDLKTVNYHQLKELGVLRIDKCNYCTYDSVDVFFSYRKEHGKTARHSAVLKLKK